jgi:fructose-bisphosphate aldolase class I
MAHHFPYLDAALQQELKKNAEAIVVAGKGILAMDDFNEGIDANLKAIGQEGTAENRRKYRQTILTAPGIEKYVSGVILYDETVHQKLDNGKTFPEHLNSLGIFAGAKVDRNEVALEGTYGEKTSQGLDDLLERAKAYKAAGCKFAKYRSPIRISDHEPSALTLAETAYVQARYSRICQQVSHSSLFLSMQVLIIFLV